MRRSTEDLITMVDSEDVRVAVYASFARAGRPPTPAELADGLNVSIQEIDTALQELAAAHHVVLDDTGNVKMAHPFSAVPLGFSVMGTSTLWWGGCAWDSFALAHLLSWEPELLVATRCPACSTPHAWNINRSAPPEGDQVAHFLIPSSHMWNDIVTTCSHQRIFCDEGCVDSWLHETDNDRGYVMDLTTLWNFASDCTDRLDRGYTRRPPAEAAKHLRSLGLSGSFWGL
jgi:hypothetical protein